MAFSDKLADILKWGRKTDSAKSDAKPQSPKDGIDRYLTGAVAASERDDEVPELRATALKSILLDAADGECEQQAALITSMIEKDEVMAAHFETRKTAVTGCDMKLIKPRSRIFEEQTDERYTEMWQMLEHAGIYELVDHLCDATPKGYAGASIEWGEGGGIINQFHTIHPTNVQFDLAGNPALWLPEKDEVTPCNKFHPNQFVWHFRKNQPGIPARTGIGRSLAWPFYFKHLTMKSWVRFIEKFGLPFLIARISEADFANEKLKSQMISRLRRFAMDGAVLTTEDGGVDAVTVAGQHNKLHEEFTAFINKGYAISILGQVGSSEGERGRLGNNAQQQEVRQDKKESDCRMLMSTINKQLIQPLWLFKYGSDLTECPVFMMDFGTPEQKKDLAETYKSLKESGYPVHRNQVAYEFGVVLDEEMMAQAAKQEGTENAAGKTTDEQRD